MNKQETIASAFDNNFYCHQHSSHHVYINKFNKTRHTDALIKYHFTKKHKCQQSNNNEKNLKRKTNLSHLCDHKTNFIFNKHPFQVNTTKKRCFQLKKAVNYPQKKIIFFNYFHINKFQPH